MKPPKCRLCESNHWNNEEHTFKSSVVGPASNSGGTGAHIESPEPTEKSTPTSKRSVPPVGSESSPARQLDKFDRTTYQREYMRKWRKK